jgi:hypothetical protein
MAAKPDPRVQHVLSRLDYLRSIRAPLEQDWRDIRDLVRPVTGDFNSWGPQYVPARRSDKVYDGTAVDSLEELASALHSYMTSPVERWFSLELMGAPEQMRDPQVLIWLEQASDAIFESYADARAMFNASLHEVYLDLGAYGTGYLGQEWHQDGHLIFRAYPVSNSFIAENSKGVVDTIYRQMHWTLRQVKQELGDLPPELEKMAQDKNDRPVTIVHGVFPRTDRVPFKLDTKNMQFASMWVCLETKELIMESGYNSFPYHCPRWVKLAGEVWGRSPAMKCLPDIKMLNSMELTIIKAAEKIVDPPLQVPDDGFLTPIRTSPGAIMYKEPNAEHIEPLLTQGNIPVGLELTNQKREFIKKCFYNDWIRMEKENQEMTAYEVQDRREEKLRLLAPMLGRQESELLGPLISRSLELLGKHNRLPAAPAHIRGRLMRAVYSSPASRAQTGVKAMTMGRFVQELIPLAQIDPTVMDVVNFDMYTKELAIARGVTRTILRTDADVTAMREQRAQEKQMEAVATMAEPATKAVKNLAEAQSKGGGLIGSI